MKNAVIIHGKPSKTKYFDPDLDSPSNALWLPWIQKQLLLREVLAQTPEMPVAWQPVYEAWRSEFERYDVTSETILIGHSCGAGFLFRWLCEHPSVYADKVVLVAPWIDPDKSGNMGDFFDFNFDSKLAERVKAFVVFNSDNDFPNAQISAQTIMEAIPGTTYHEFKQYGHFTEITEFPELQRVLFE